MNETMIYELKNLMKNAKAALEIAHYYGELPTFVNRKPLSWLFRKLLIPLH